MLEASRMTPNSKVIKSKLQREVIDPYTCTGIISKEYPGGLD
jgi:hypothetical protein